MSQQSLVKARSFYVAKNYFCVAIEFSQGQEFPCRDKVFLVLPQSLALDGVFMSRQGIVTSRQILAYTGDLRS